MFKQFNLPAGIITLLIGIWCVTPGLIAQDKIGYIDSPKVLSVYPAAIEANKQLETENNKWSLELQKLQEKFRAITEQLDKQSLLLSDAKKKEKEQERQAVYEEIQKYQDKKWGDRGDYFTLQRDLVKPVFDEINAVLTRIGEEEDFDYIFDTSQGFILYAKDKYDLTDRVILELEKEAPATPKKQ